MSLLYIEHIRIGKLFILSFQLEKKHGFIATTFVGIADYDAAQAQYSQNETNT